jgi:uncharacterized protein (DUF58 family)
MMCRCLWRVELVTQRWFFFLSLFFAAGVLLRAPLVVLFSTALAVILGIMYWWQKHALDGVTYRRRFHYTRGFPGEQVRLRLEVENLKLLPISWLKVLDPWPRAVGPDNEAILSPSHIPDQGFLVHIFSLRWYERLQRTYTLLFRKRGVYRVGPVSLTSGDFFGVYEQSEAHGTQERLSVFPALLPASELDLAAEDPFGERKSRRRLYEDPNRPMGVREYHPEDGFRKVHWPATARTGQLQVKVYQPTSTPVLVVCLNVSTFARPWEGVYPELLEHLLSVTATLVTQGFERGYRVGLISNGCLSNSDQPFRIPPGRTPDQLGHLLTALAGVTAITALPFERFLVREVPRLPYGATLVIVTALLSSELAETLLKLKRHERSITLISLAKEKPGSIPGIHSIHQPFERL